MRRSWHAQAPRSPLTIVVCNSRGRAINQDDPLVAVNNVLPMARDRAIHACGARRAVTIYAPVALHYIRKGEFQKSQQRA